MARAQCHVRGLRIPEEQRKISDRCLLAVGHPRYGTFTVGRATLRTRCSLATISAANKSPSLDRCAKQKDEGFDCLGTGIERCPHFSIFAKRSETCFKERPRAPCPWRATSCGGQMCLAGTASLSLHPKNRRPFPLFEKNVRPLEK